MSIKLSPEVGNKEYFVLRNIAGGHSMSGFEVIEEEGGGGGALDPTHPRSQAAKKDRSEKGNNITIPSGIMKKFYTHGNSHQVRLLPLNSCGHHYKEVFERYIGKLLPRSTLFHPLHIYLDHENWVSKNINSFYYLAI